MTQARAGKTHLLVRVRRVAVGLPQLWAIWSLAGIFIVLALVLVRPHDFWWHVRAGQWIVENGRIPKADLFSFTRAGEPWAYQSWLMEVLFYLLFRAGGLPLVIFFHAVVVTAGYGLLLGVDQRASNGNLRWAALATIAAAALGVNNWNVRPQTISYLFFSIVLYLTEREASLLAAARSQLRSSRALWCLPLLFAVWANAHGGFVFGLALLGTFLLPRVLAWLRGQCGFPLHLLLIALLSAGATLLTPLGVGMIDYVLGFVRHPVTRSLNVEFMPPTVRTLSGQLFFGFLVAWIALSLVSRYRLTLHESVRLLLFGGLALMALRNTAWFGFAAAPTMAASLSRWASSRGEGKSLRAGRPAMNRAVAAAVGLVVLLSLPWFRPHLRLLPQSRRAYVSPETPVQAVAFLRDLPQPRRVFHEEVYGSYMIWASPEVPVFVDTRIELYPATQWGDYLALSVARYDWQAILERYEVDTLLLQRDEQEWLINAAMADPGWERRYEDEQAVIFQRRGGP